MNRGALVGVWLSLMVGASPALASGGLGGKVGTLFDAPPPSTPQVAAHARRLFDEALKALPAAARLELERDLRELDALKDDERASRSAQFRAASATLFKAKQVDVAYAAYAVMKTPDDAQAVGNLGAVVIDTPAVAVPLLLQAKRLAPKNPGILTNLGAAALDLGANERARRFYEDALAVDGDHQNALLGMAYYFMRRPDHRRALEYFYKANGFSYEPKYLEQQTTDEKGKRKPPPAPIEATGTRWGQPVRPERRKLPEAAWKLKLPRVPNWSGPEAFVAGFEKRRKLAEWFGEAAGKPLGEMMQTVQGFAAGGGIGQAAAAARSGDRQRDPWMSVYSDGDLAVGHVLSLNHAWAEEKVARADAAFQAAMNGPVDRFSRQMVDQMEDFGSAWTSCLKRSGSTGVVDCRPLMIAHCKKLRPIRLKAFGAWRDAYRQWDASVRPVQEELYRVQAGWIGQLQDRQTWEAANRARDLAVFMPHAMMMVQEEMMLLNIVGTSAGGFGGIETCPEETAENEEAPEEDPPPEKDDVSQLRCPFVDANGNDAPLEVGLGAASFAVDCKGWEAKFSAGVVLAARRTFGRDRTTTVFVGVGAQLQSKGIMPVGGGVSAEAGLTMTIGADNQVKSWGLSAKAGAEGNVGGMKVAAELSGVIERGPKGTTFTSGYQHKGGVGGFTQSTGSGSKVYEAPPTPATYKGK